MNMDFQIALSKRLTSILAYDKMNLSKEKEVSKMAEFRAIMTNNESRPDVTRLMRNGGNITLNSWNYTSKVSASAEQLYTVGPRGGLHKAGKIERFWFDLSPLNGFMRNSDRADLHIRVEYNQDTRETDLNVSPRTLELIKRQYGLVEKVVIETDY